MCSLDNSRGKLVISSQSDPRTRTAGMISTRSDHRRSVFAELDQTSDVLMKAGMDQVPLSRCNASFSRALSSRLARGVTPDQLCARGSNGVADTCLVSAN